MASVLVTIAVAATALFVVALLFALIVSVRLDLDVDVGGEQPTQSVAVRIRWWRFEWTPGRVGTPRSADEGPATDCALPPHPVATPPPAPRARRSRATARVRALLTTRGFLRRIARLVLDEAHALLPYRAVGAVRFGAEDPGSTGVLFGAVQAAARRTRTWQVRIEPDFTHAVVAAQGHLEWAVRPVAIVGPIVLFLLSPVTIRAVLAAWRVEADRCDRARDLSRNAESQAATKAAE